MEDCRRCGIEFEPDIVNPLAMCEDCIEELEQRDEDWEKYWKYL